MKHEGKARSAAFKLIFLALVIVAVIGALGFFATIIGPILVTVSIVLFFVWILFSIFTLYFFRDPTARVPADVGCVVAPGHGKVDVIDEMDEPVFMKGR